MAVGQRRRRHLHAPYAVLEKIPSAKLVPDYMREQYNVQEAMHTAAADGASNASRYHLMAAIAGNWPSSSTRCRSRCRGTTRATGLGVTGWYVVHGHFLFPDNHLLCSDGDGDDR
jgi:hypothetical protein